MLTMTRPAAIALLLAACAPADASDPADTGAPAPAGPPECGDYWTCRVDSAPFFYTREPCAEELEIDPLDCGDPGDGGAFVRVPTASASAGAAALTHESGLVVAFDVECTTDAAELANGRLLPVGLAGRWDFVVACEGASDATGRVTVPADAIADWAAVDAGG